MIAIYVPILLNEQKPCGHEGVYKRTCRRILLGTADGCHASKKNRTRKATTRGRNACAVRRLSLEQMFDARWKDGNFESALTRALPLMMRRFAFAGRHLFQSPTMSTAP